MTRRVMMGINTMWERVANDLNLDLPETFDGSCDELAAIINTAMGGRPGYTIEAYSDEIHVYDDAADPDCDDGSDIVVSFIIVFA